MNANDEKLFHSLECQAQFGVVHRCTCNYDAPHFHGSESDRVIEKPRCDFYYVLMNEEGQYYDSDSLGFHGILAQCDKYLSQEQAENRIKPIWAGVKVYKVHSPIIECCEE